MQLSMSLKYEPSSEPLLVSVKQLFLNRESLPAGLPPEAESFRVPPGPLLERYFESLDHLLT